MKRALVAVFIFSMGLFGVSTPAWAVTGHQSIVEYVQSGQPVNVFASGPVAGVGTAPNDNAEVSTVTFPNGTITVSHPVTSFSQTFDPTTCVGTFQFKGTYTLTHGTGAYRGISGHGTATGNGVFIANRTAHGCSQEGQVFGVIRTEGTTTLP